MTLFDVESTDFLLAEIFLQLLEVVREGIDNAIAVDEWRIEWLISAEVCNLRRKFPGIELMGELIYQVSCKMQCI